MVTSTAMVSVTLATVTMANARVVTRLSSIYGTCEFLSNVYCQAGIMQGAEDQYSTHSNDMLRLWENFGGSEK